MLINLAGVPVTGHVCQGWDLGPTDDANVEWIGRPPTAAAVDLDKILVQSLGAVVIKQVLLKLTLLQVGVTN